MKKLILKITVMVVVCLTFLVACEKNEEMLPEMKFKDLSYESMHLAQANDFATSVRITCPGCNADGCSFRQTRDGEGKWYGECGHECNQCSMNVTVSKLYYNLSPTVTETYQAERYEIHFYKAFEEHVNEIHGGEEVKINGIEIITDPLHDTYTILYEYKVASKQFSVRFSLAQELTTKIDCSGSCECRERYYYQTGATECTCSPCHMDVSEISKSLY